MTCSSEYNFCVKAFAKHEFRDVKASNAKGTAFILKLIYRKLKLGNLFATYYANNAKFGN